jgi:hypothetical protein
MSKLNGDRARFRKDRRRRLHRRQRVQVLIAGLRKRAADEAATDAASLRMDDDGGPPRIVD